MTIARFRTLILAHYRAHGRHDLPWRKTRDPYKVLVSEVMLQQTQVERVIPYYERFLEAFPDVAALAQAPLSKVLTLWQGLGYNRRAKMLHDAAKVAVRDYGGKVPSSVDQLVRIPGIGPYTAGAVVAFSGNRDTVFIETNIRTAVLHHLFPEEEKVPDSEVLAILEKALPKGKAREWYSALMDYGSFLKRTGVRVNAKSTGYTKQKRFAGSAREARGAVLRALSDGPKSLKKLYGLLGPERREQVKTQIAALLKEGLIERSKSTVQLPS